jgi:amino acid transporter
MDQHNGLRSRLSVPTSGVEDSSVQNAPSGAVNDYALRVPPPVQREGDETHLRIVAEQQKELRRVRNGVLEATEQVNVPHSPPGLLWYYTKRILIGKPLPTVSAERERLTKVKALALLSSDAISSVAYATEAILFNLAAAGSAHLGLTLPISMVIIALLAIVAISYRQTIPAYPNGGGSYIVAKENLGTVAGLVAAAALLIDYVLNVSVSIAAGVLNLASLFPILSPYIIALDVALVVLITLINLRGVRESGSILAFPTYFFVVTALLLIIVGVIKAFVVGHQPLIGQFAPLPQTESLTLFLLLRAFATGCSAMTGVEAISNGIPVFQKPQTRNAATTLTWMAVILGTLFFGITVLAMTFHVEANAAGHPTVIAQIAAQVFTGRLGFLFPVFQMATLGILILSAETSYSDFPRLTSLLARDKFLPDLFTLRGDRLAFTTGILVLALLASLLLVVFKGSTDALINLFAVGVFMSFTLSQAGMVRHWWRLHGPHWQRSMVINGLGACTTLLVALIISFSKFLEGAWVVVLLIPLLVVMFLAIQKHYTRFERERTTYTPMRPEDIHHRLVVPIEVFDDVAIESLAYARSISSQVTAVHVAMDENETTQMEKRWEQWQQENLTQQEDTHLLIIESPYRTLVPPLLAYIDTVHERHPDVTLSVLLPDYVITHWWEYLLHNQTIIRLKAALRSRPGIVVIDMPEHLPPRRPAHREQ